MNHNVLCYGYTLEILRQGKFSAERAKEQDIPLKYWNPLQKGQTIEADGITYTPEMVLGPARKGIRLTYTTDTRPTESILRNAKESDLFICEGMYGEDDKADKARGYKHMTFREAAVLARDARVKEMWLTHYSPSLVRPDEFMDKVREIFPNAYPGKDGKVYYYAMNGQTGTINGDFPFERKKALLTSVVSALFVLIFMLVGGYFS